MITRIKNESRWIRRNLERTFQVASAVVIWDDGSTDDTERICDAAAKAAHPKSSVVYYPWGWVREWNGAGGACHYLRSPFAEGSLSYTIRSEQRVNEIRDKNALWSYCKVKVPFTYVLCLDGDEMLSNLAVERFPTYLKRLDDGTDAIAFPFVFLWDSETQRRSDGIYNSTWHIRLFTIQRLSPGELFGSTFASRNPGGFHCGWVPFQPKKIEACREEIVHFGYIDAGLREEKLRFYTRIDPTGEAGYTHVVGRPNSIAPGPLKVEPWSDT